jgi:flagellar basal-body rod modification protein FlgD
MSAVNGGTNSVGTDSASQDKFLKLLVTQMKNQDPLNPMDNAQVTSQMAQLSTVTGVNQLNTSVEGLRSDLQANQTFEATGLIGHEVLVSGSTMDLAQGGAAFGVSLASAADSVKVSIKDSAGRVVRTMELGSAAAGSKVAVWDGTCDDGSVAAPGKYSFDASAKVGEGSVGANTLAYGQVVSVSSGPAGVKLNLANGGTATMSEVNQVI